MTTRHPHGIVRFKYLYLHPVDSAVGGVVGACGDEQQVGVGGQAVAQGHVDRVTATTHGLGQDGVQALQKRGQRNE